MYFRLIDIIYSITCFQLLIFIFLLIHKGRKKLSNLILAAFFGVQFIVIFNFLVVGFCKFGSSFHITIAYYHYPFEFLWGPLLYFYIKSQTSLNFKFKPIHFIHSIPFILVAAFIVLYYYVQGFERKQSIVNDGLIYKWMDFLNYPYFLLLFSYNFSALYLIVKFQRHQKDYYSSVVEYNLGWLKIVMVGYIIACLCTAITIFTNQFKPMPLHIFLIILFIPYLLFFNILFYKAVIHPDVIVIPEEKPKYAGLNLDKTHIQNHAKSIESYIITHKPYLNQTLTLQDLSEATGINERSISQVINNYWKQNFFSFINSFRIEEAKSMLLTIDMNKTTMEGISFNAGFNSKSAFYEAFKRHTGMTPMEYRKTKF